MRSNQPSVREELPAEGEEERNRSIAWLTVLCFVAWVSESADRNMIQGAALALAGTLMIFYPARKSVSPLVWLGAAVWLFGSLLVFLPASWVPQPEWRSALETAGVPMGDRITPQPGVAIVSLGGAAATGIVALWAAHQTSNGSRVLAIGIAFAIALYGLLAWIRPVTLHLHPDSDHPFGFFANRNHSATLLVTGAVLALGILVQGIRERSRLEICAGGTILLFLLVLILGVNESRAGVLLLGIGFVLWIAMVGPRYFVGDTGKAAVLLAGGSILFFALTDTPVKQRLSAMALPLFPNASDPGTINREASSVDGLDARLAIQLDTIRLISAAPLTGWGSRQFSDVFPQYQNRTLTLAHKRCLHPESDWLKMAAEHGMPAMVAIVGIVASFTVIAILAIRKRRHRARHGGLLIAALILPIHGLFDVPGGHFSLLWTSALLFALAVGPGRLFRFQRASAIGWRCAGLMVSCLGVTILIVESSGKSLNPSDRAERLLHEASELYQVDHTRAIAPGKGINDHATGTRDPLEKALAGLDQASRLTPLDHRIWGLQGMLALHFDDKDELARKSFEIQRRLEPNWVELPLTQSEAWSRISPADTSQLWIESFQRAARSPYFRDGTNSKRLMGEVLRIARDIPELQHAARELVKTVSVPVEVTDKRPP